MDSMDIDTADGGAAPAPPRAPSPPPSASAPPPPPPRRDPTPAALAALTEGLAAFAHEQARRALGDDLFEFYLPPPDADARALLRYTRDKWIGVFSDSPLEPHRAALERLEDVAHASRRAVNPLPAATADAAVTDIQTVLLAMRKPGLAAKVADLASSAARDAARPAARGPAAEERERRVRENAARPAPFVAASTAPFPYAAQAQAVPAAPADQPMAVALDGSNIAWRHGLSRRFSIRGVAEALAYFVHRGHPCVVFLPEGRLRDAPHAPPDGPPLPEGELEAFHALKHLEGSAALVLTPEKDYDDCYITHFAREYMAVVVSNDRFEDQVYQAQAEGAGAAEEWRQWIAACRLPFTFHADTFVPNPMFSMVRAESVAKDLQRPATAPPSR